MIDIPKIYNRQPSPDEEIGTSHYTFSNAIVFLVRNIRSHKIEEEWNVQREPGLQLVWPLLADVLYDWFPPYTRRSFS